MPDYDWIDPFREEPQTERDILRDLWHRNRRFEAECRSEFAAIKKQTTLTNGRVTRLERFQWAVGGGIAVVGIVLVPLFVYTVQRI